MQAIRTRYHGPTDTRGSRISAACEAGRIYMPYRHELNLENNHAAAVGLLVVKLGWHTSRGDRATMVGGGFDGDMYWVFDGDMYLVFSDGPPAALPEGTPL